MSLMIAIPFAIASAIAYGCSTAVEHSAAHEPDGPGGARALLRLLRNPRWLLGMAGDTLGLIFQIIALATGPVILVQPILVLALPVSLPIAFLLGGPQPRPVDYRSCLLIILALSLFFVLIGTPGPADGLTSTQVVAATAVVVGIGVGLLGAAQLLLKERTGARSAIVGGVAGGWFGFVAVLMDAVATAWDDGGLHAMGQSRGLVPLAVLVVLGVVSIALTQAAFQIGALGASFRRTGRGPRGGHLPRRALAARGHTTRSDTHRCLSALPRCHRARDSALGGRADRLRTGVPPPP